MNKPYRNTRYVEVIRNRSEFKNAPTLRPRKHELCLIDKSRLNEQILCTDYSSKICIELN